MRAARCARALLAVVAVATTLTGARATTTDASTTARAGVIVDTGTTVYTRVISFDGTISGLDALRLAGANPVTTAYSGQGAAVCQLFGVGNDPSSCLVGPGGAYWAYFRAPAGASGFSYSSAGAGATTVHDGDVEGWRYGTGAKPPFTSFCDLAGCAPAPTQAPPVSDTTPAPAPNGATATPNGGSGAGATTMPTTPTTAATGSTTTAAGAASGAVATTSTTRAAARRDGTRTAATAALRSGGGDGGSPTGLVVAGAILVVVAGAAVALRRRRLRYRAAACTVSSRRATPPAASTS